jgi:hypothetical protein
MEWNSDADAPRVVVCDGRTGDFVCQSLVGQPFEIDSAPGAWFIDPSPDEVERFEVEQRKAPHRSRS